MRGGILLCVLLLATLALSACTSERLVIQTITQTQTATKIQTVIPPAETTTQTITQTQTMTIPPETITVTQTAPVIPKTTTSTSSLGLSRDNPVPMGETFLTPDGIEITIMNLIKGEEAWEIIHEANSYNDPPSEGMQYAIITIKCKNISSEDEPYSLWIDLDLDLIGSSSKVFKTYDRSVVLPDEGELSDLDAELYHNGEDIGSLNFYIPENETNLILIESFFFQDYRIYYEVR